jgi:hypothetical protein
MKSLALSVVMICVMEAALGTQDARATEAAARGVLGHLSANPYAPGSTANSAGRSDPSSVTNPQGPYGSRVSPTSAANPFATATPTLEDSAGRYRGKLSANPFDADSVSNPYGRYGSASSPDSINNPFGAGNPYAPESPHNRYGQGLRILAPQ